MPTVKDVIVRRPSQAELAQCKSWPIWSCRKSTFDWDYTQQETCLILEGRVVVKDRPGPESVSFGPGDMAIFPKELKCVWQVDEPVKKHYKFD